MPAIVLLLCSFAALKIGRWLLIVVMDALATAIAAYYIWRSTHIGREMLAGRSPACSTWAIPSRRQRRLMARHLQLSLAMTAHYSLFPRSAARGYALADALVRRFS